MDKKTILCWLIILTLITVAFYAYPYVWAEINSLFEKGLSLFQENMIR